MLVICASLPAARSAIMHLVYGEGGGSSAPSYGHSSAAAHNMYFRHQGDSKDQGSHQLRSLGQSDAGSKSQPGMTESDEELVNREPSKWSAN